jgi:Family of unknown function (DUF6065)
MSSEDTDSAHAGPDIGAKRTVVEPSDDRSVPRLVAYELPTTRLATNQGIITRNNEGNEGFELVRAHAGRHWMNAISDRFADRSLPMLNANQAGWLILNNSRLTFRWNIPSPVNSIEFLHRQNENSYRWATGHFGYGIITWSFPFLFRTSPGYNLLVRGPANHFKDGIAPLEGVVEADWMPTTFTMSWKITRPGLWITFEPGEPVCMLVPQRRGELEAFHPQILPLDAESELRASFDSWLDSREPSDREFVEDLNDSSTAAATLSWRKHRFQGRFPDGSTAPERQTGLRLRPFARPEGE